MGDPSARTNWIESLCSFINFQIYFLIDIPTVWLCQHMGGQAARPGLTYLITPGLSSNIYGFSFLIHSRWCVTVPPQSASSSFFFFFFFFFFSFFFFCCCNYISAGTECIVDPNKHYMQNKQTNKQINEKMHIVKEKEKFGPLVIYALICTLSFLNS